MVTVGRVALGRGAPGTCGTRGVTWTVSEGLPPPLALRARTWKPYTVPLVSPVTVWLVSVEPVVVKPAEGVQPAPSQGLL